MYKKLFLICVFVTIALTQMQFATAVEPPRLPDRPAQDIYDEAIHSVVWILTYQRDGFVKGSGVLINERHRLVVTNAHVIHGAASIFVFFPWRYPNGDLEKKEDFYLDNSEWLESRGYVTQGRVITQDVRNDLAIIQLNQLPPTAHQIKHIFSKSAEDSMERGDKVHILGNPGNRLWNWTQGTFLQYWKNCPPSGGECLEMEGDTQGGNSGGPVLNGQGTLIGLLTAGTDETGALAVPARNVKALMKMLPMELPVELSHFRPTRDKATGAVVITWSTQSELNNAGFFIKRSQQQDGEFKVINATMIAGAGTTSEKQTYTYTDTTAQPNVAYYYQIEDVSLDGDRQTLTRGIRLKGHVRAVGKTTVIWGALKASHE